MNFNRTYGLIVVIVLGILILGSAIDVRGVDLDVGEKVYESDLDVTGNQWYHFDSNCTIGTKPYFIPFVPSLLDANKNTGLDHDFGSGATAFMVIVEFPYDFFVKNITVDPVFNGQYTKCNFGISTKTSGNYIEYNIITEKTFKINGMLAGFYFQLIPDGETHLYFNDVIIEYEPRPSNVEDLLTAFDHLSDQFDTLYAQIGNIPDQISQIQNEIAIIKANISSIESDLSGIHNMIADLNDAIDDLTVSIDEMDNYISEMNLSITSSFESLKINLSVLDGKITEILLELEEFDPDEVDISVLMNKTSSLMVEINQTIERLELFEGDVIDIRENLPVPFDDTSFIERIMALEAENNVLESEIYNLTSEIDDLKEIEPDEHEEGTNNTLSFIGIGIGTCGLIIALIAVFIRFPRRNKNNNQMDSASKPIQNNNEMNSEIPDESESEQEMEDPLNSISEIRGGEMK